MRQVGFLIVAAVLAVSSIAVAQPNVKMDAIVVPSGMVDSGQIIDPRVVVSNIGTVLADSFDVYLMIDNELDRVLYRDSIVLLNVPPGSVDTVYLSRWVPEGRDSVGAFAWVYWQDDVVRADDTVYERFLVRARNIGITNVYVPTPRDTIPPGTIRPRPPSGPVARRPGICPKATKAAPVQQQRRRRAARAAPRPGGTPGPAGSLSLPGPVARRRGFCPKATKGGPAR